MTTFLASFAALLIASVAIWPCVGLLWLFTQQGVDRHWPGWVVVGVSMFIGITYFALLVSVAEHFGIV